MAASRHSLRARIAVLILLLILAFAGFLTWNHIRSGTAPGTINSIAVLPFVNASNDPGTHSSRPWRVAPYRYGIVLALILASLAFQLAAPDRDWARLVTIGLQGVTLLAALEVSQVHPWILLASRALVVVAIVSSTGALIGFGTLGPTAGSS